MTVRKIIENKGNRVAHVPPDSLVSDILETLELEVVGALVVSRDGKMIEGIISESDIIRGLRSHGADVLNHLVSDLMTTEVVTCQLHHPLIDVVALMNSNTIRHVPVVKDDSLAGIISVHDIVKDRLNEVENEANAMRSYICS